MSTPTLDRSGDVYVLNLGDDENRWNPDYMQALIDSLDVAEAAPAPRALVTTATGKIWSNGLDLNWTKTHPDRLPEFIDLFNQVLTRFLVSSVPCVAAIGGHAFGGGALLSLAHDYRIMRADRGYWCLPESDLGLTFTDGSAALVQAKVPPAAAHLAMLTAHRFPGPEAAAQGIVHEAVPFEQVLESALSRAQEWSGKDGSTMTGIKHRLFGRVHELLLADSLKAH